MTRSLTILGATGSVGRSTADVVLAHTGPVPGRGGRRRARRRRLWQTMARRLGAQFAALADESARADLKDALVRQRASPAGQGDAAVLEAVDREADDRAGGHQWDRRAASRPHAALRPGRTLALANKESLVCAGAAFMRDARRLGVSIMPVDSEHNALDQALTAGRNEDVEKAIITATGGPFRTWTREQDRRCERRPRPRLIRLVHGSKINIDSATLMNKGLELIEAHHLFDLEAERLDVRGPSGSDRPWARAMARRSRHGRPGLAGHEGADRQRPASPRAAPDGPASSRSCRDRPIKLRRCRTRRGFPVCRWHKPRCGRVARCRRF